MNKPLIWTLVGTVVLVATGAVIYGKTSGVTDGASAGTYDTLAQCIADSGAKFYGAFWCPHCQNQKQAFGSAAKSLPYIECSTPDGRGQTQVCTDADVTSYPTWEFANGERLSGEVALQTLADKTSCAFPASGS